MERELNRKRGEFSRASPVFARYSLGIRCYDELFIFFAMEARVSQLEELIFGKNHINPSHDLQTRLNQLEVAVSSLEKAKPAIAELFKKGFYYTKLIFPFCGV